MKNKMENITEDCEDCKRLREDYRKEKLGIYEGHYFMKDIRIRKFLEYNPLEIEIIKNNYN